MGECRPERWKMNTQNDADNAADFEALYLAYKAKYEAAQAKIDELVTLVDSLRHQIAATGWLP